MKLIIDIPEDELTDAEIAEALRIAEVNFSGVEVVKGDIIPASNDWQEYNADDKSTHPKKDGTYLVTKQAYDGWAFVGISSFSENLYEVDNYDFYDSMCPGWYGCCDLEYGYYKEDNIIGWKILDKPMECKKGDSDEGV